MQKSGKWLEEDEQKLAQLSAVGNTISKMARELGRKESSVRAKLTSLDQDASDSSTVNQKRKTVSSAISLAQLVVLATIVVIVSFACRDIKVFDEDGMMTVAASWWQFLLISLTPLSLYLILKFKSPWERRWSDARVLALNELANNGESMEYIAAQISSEHHLITVQSVRSKLVSLGTYEKYQDSYFERLERDYQKQAEMRGMPIQDSVPIQEAQLIELPFVKRLINSSETKFIEFKQTFNCPLDHKDYAVRHAAIDIQLNHAVVKSVAAFLNTGGGYLIIGVHDTPPHKITGLFNDKFEGEDKYIRRLSDILKGALGRVAMANIGMKILRYGADDICIVSCKSGKSAVWCNHTVYNSKILGLKESIAKKHKLFYVRYPKGVEELDPEQAYEHIINFFSEST